MPAARAIRHAITVARTSGHPLLGLLHDSVEDGWLPGALCRVWPALDAITRREGEAYRAYIERVAANPAARAVKLADLAHNTRTTPPGDLAKRYAWAKERLARP